MRILHRYLAREIYASTAFVFAALLSLFAFFDLIHELGDLGKGNYRLPQIMGFVALNLPGHVYELFPIAALIGTLFALAQLSAHSEFTVMRVSGLSTQRFALSLMQTGMVFVLLTLLFGELITPGAERMAEQLRLKATSSVVAQEFRSGLWLKDDRSFVNVREILPDTTLLGVKIFQYDSGYHLKMVSYSDRGHYETEGRWLLEDVTQTHFEGDRTTVEKLPQLAWKSVLNPDILSVLLVVPEQMSAWNLYQYVVHLRENKQKTIRYEIALWSKLAYPFATLVMMIFALPFAYHQTRSGGIGGKIFLGIMVGLSFHLLNRVFAHLGLLNDWPPLFSASFPAIAFLSIALGMIWWMERR
ncbi:LPS export ABC transporter permease LptG [Sulfurimicrobium lacus]|uniref:LPS export ABC transporter permease LptG n=1 Tax=Sulfurimicrobium lacus TaxID=2715678 RepID=A0A6F8V9M9_9PROT|nr:LPS export ABC transporter permease LptG [Sulfurimicrobium lacus]BCB26364.1 LPS export ABC transporter permease LptG [Sulfurimicrobium lacus]